MATTEVVEEQAGDRSEYAGVLRYYELAKKQEWQVRDLPWGEIPPIPEGNSRLSALVFLSTTFLVEGSGTISSLNRPAGWPVAVRRWLSSEYSSCASRETP